MGGEEAGGSEGGEGPRRGVREDRRGGRVAGRVLGALDGVCWCCCRAEVFAPHDAALAVGPTSLEHLLGLAPLQLARGGLGQHARLEQPDLLHGQTHLHARRTGHLLCDRPQHRVLVAMAIRRARQHRHEPIKAALPPGAPLAEQRVVVHVALARRHGQRLDLLRPQLTCDAHALSLLALHGEGRAAAGSHDVTLGLDGLLDVLRDVLAPPDDDHVLGAAGDEELALVEEAGVAGPQEGPLLLGCVGGAREGGPERLMGLLRHAEVALGRRGRRQPHLTHLALGKQVVGGRIHYRNSSVGGRESAADDDLSLGRVCPAGAESIPLLLNPNVAVGFYL
mmetsp:Transcript_36522/g.104610  ORF Transcript_36522/g.104610 Transcript_36522/m.104610 type:complete len:337 (+) Transcript_36522:226-1236(+)